MPLVRVRSPVQTRLGAVYFFEIMETRAEQLPLYEVWAAEVLGVENPFSLQMNEFNHWTMKERGLFSVSDISSGSRILSIPVSSLISKNVALDSEVSSSVFFPFRTFNYIYIDFTFA